MNIIRCTKYAKNSAAVNPPQKHYLFHLCVHMCITTSLWWFIVTCRLLGYAELAPNAITELPLTSVAVTAKPFMSIQLNRTIAKLNFLLTETFAWRCKGWQQEQIHSKCTSIYCGTEKKGWILFLKLWNLILRLILCVQMHLCRNSKLPQILFLFAILSGYVHLHWKSK